MCYDLVERKVFTFIHLPHFVYFDLLKGRYLMRLLLFHMNITVVYKRSINSIKMKRDQLWTDNWKHTVQEDNQMMIIHFGRALILSTSSTKTKKDDHITFACWAVQCSHIVFWAWVCRDEIHQKSNEAETISIIRKILSDFQLIHSKSIRLTFPWILQIFGRRSKQWRRRYNFS